MRIADEVAVTRLALAGRLPARPKARVARPARFSDSQVRWFATEVITIGIVYNTNLVRQRPQSRNDPLRPDAEGRVIMPSPLCSGAVVIHVGTLAEQPGFGWAYFEKLAAAGTASARSAGRPRRAGAGSPSGLRPRQPGRVAARCAALAGPSRAALPAAARAAILRARSEGKRMRERVAERAGEGVFELLRGLEAALAEIPSRANRRLA